MTIHKSVLKEYIKLLIGEGSSTISIQGVDIKFGNSDGLGPDNGHGDVAEEEDSFNSTDKHGTNGTNPKAHLSWLHAARSFAGAKPSTHE